MRNNKLMHLKHIGKLGQEKLSKSTVAILGLGTLGSNVASLLARLGVNLILVDRDIIEIDNLDSQSSYSEEDVGLEKSIVTKNHLSKINSRISIKAYITDLNYTNICIIEKADLVLDCTDNIETRFLINEYCLLTKKPWVYAGIVGHRGMVLGVDNKYCFNCVFKEPTEDLETCSTSGVMNTIGFLISGIQANEAIRFLVTNNFAKGLIYFDVWNLDFRRLNVQRRRDCVTCSGSFSYINGVKGNSMIKMCGVNSYQFTGRILDFDKIKNYSYKSRYSISTPDFIAFKDGRVIVKAGSEKAARVKYGKYFG